MRVTIGRSILLCLSVGLLACTASAQWTADFEPPTYVGSPAGTALTGQDGWYNPVSGSADAKVFTYAGNTYAISQNPYGGQQFVGGRHEGATAYARAQRDYNWAAQDVWKVTYDVCGKYTGTLPAANNLGSFSLQPSTTARYFQSILQWVDPNSPGAWNHGFYTLEHPTTGTPLVPAGFGNLPADHWYRVGITFQMSTQTIVSAEIWDTSGGPVTTVPINEHFLNPTGTAPTALRFFTGGGTAAGNFVGWDNFSIVPEPASLALLATVVLLRRR